VRADRPGEQRDARFRIRLAGALARGPRRAAATHAIRACAGEVAGVLLVAHCDGAATALRAIAGKA